MFDHFFSENYDEILKLVNHLKIGVFITDAEGNVLMLNDESCETGDTSREDLVGKNMANLELIGHVEESSSLRAIQSGEVETMIQYLGNGNSLLVVSKPMYENGKLKCVITTEKDITETLLLKKLLEERVRESRTYKQEVEYLKTMQLEAGGEVIVADPISKTLVSQMEKIAKLDVTVLLTGESGTGKEVYANHIYNNSSRVKAPFIKVNCAAIPDNLFESEMFGYEEGAFTGAQKGGKLGYFELTNNGTLFLDEIAEVPFYLQSKLLRALQEGEIRRVGGSENIKIDVRLITATNVNLEEAVKQKRFRNDLLYRLNMMPFEIPSLRQRRQDIQVMADSFVELFNKKYKTEKYLTDKAISLLEDYDWPGNVRELKNFIERCIVGFEGFEINGSVIKNMINTDIREDDLMDDKESLPKRVANYEKKLIMEALDESKNASKAADKLGLTRATLSRKMQKYKIDVK